MLKNVAAANKDHCVVMKLVSRGLLKEFLNIEADRGKNTVRLVDINSVQPGFFKPKSADKVPVWYSRGKFVGKFDEKDLSQFVTAPIK